MLQWLHVGYGYDVSFGTLLLRSVHTESVDFMSREVYQINHNVAYAKMSVGVIRSSALYKDGRRVVKFAAC